MSKPTDDFWPWLKGLGAPYEPLSSLSLGEFVRGVPPPVPAPEADNLLAALLLRPAPAPEVDNWLARILEGPALPRQSPFARTPEPEVPPSERRAVAWANLPEGQYLGVKTTREGKIIIESAYGDRQSE